ncbi:toxin [Lentisalinibacter orientalis]|uniref:toxin n=1 Tax=Lentisalinibacter orientalis TaxID=2992241 RepID=UPI00387091C6
MSADQRESAIARSVVLPWDAATETRVSASRPSVTKSDDNRHTLTNVGVLDHPNQDRYAGQRVFVIAIDDYAYLVPFVEDDDEVFLKTIIPSRKATRKYLDD